MISRSDLSLFPSGALQLRGCKGLLCDVGSKVTRGCCREALSIFGCLLAGNGVSCRHHGWVGSSSVRQDQRRPPRGEPISRTIPVTSQPSREPLATCFYYSALQLPYPKLASLNGAHFFANSLEAELKSCTNGGAKTVWKSYYDR